MNMEWLLQLLQYGHWPQTLQQAAAVTAAWFSQHYDWLGTLVFLALIFTGTKLARFAAFKNPGLQRMRAWNKTEDQPKIADPKWRPVMAGGQRVGLIVNGAFLLALCPLVVTLDAMPWWRYIADVALVLMVYDFFYYLVHRYIFHGPIMKKIHGLHHQARSPSWSDALYVHSTETFIGLGMFIACLSLIGFALGGIHAATVAVTYLIYVQLNTINHTKFNLDYFPFKTVNYLTTKHHIHHENMNMGNYGSITPLYDWMFRTLD